MSTELRKCWKCGTSLHRGDDSIFTGTVLAEGSHKCKEAQKVIAQAATAAEIFASQRVIHAPSQAVL